MNTIIILYIYTAVAMGHADSRYAARDWVPKGEYASVQHCTDAAERLAASARFRCIDSGIPFKK